LNLGGFRVAFWRGKGENLMKTKAWLTNAEDEFQESLGTSFRNTERPFVEKMPIYK
jgi:hypothetical protein